MRLWVTVLNAAGTILGKGPLARLKSVQVASALDGAGEVTVAVPLADERVQELVAPERRVRVFLAEPPVETTVIGQLDYTGCTFSASVAAPSHPAADAFDRDAATWWQTTGSSSGQLQVGFSTAHTVRSYSLKCRTGYDSGMPRNFTFQYFEGTWKTADTQTDQAWGATTWRRYSLAVPVTATFFRLSASGSDGATALNVGDFDLYGDVPALLPVKRELGRGIIRDLGGQAQAGDLTVQCIDSLDELRRVNVGLGLEYNNADLATALDDLVGLVPGWTIDHTGTSGTLYAQMSGVSVLKALQEIVRQTGYHFRLDAPNSVKLGDLGDESGLVLLQAGRSLRAEAQAADDVALIRGITWHEQSEGVVNHVIPVGGGEGEQSLTLALSDRPFYLKAAFDIADVGWRWSWKLRDVTIGYISLAQSFSLDTTTIVNKVRLWMYKVGSPTGTITAAVRTNNGDVPGTNVDPNATKTIDVATLPNGLTLVDFVFPASFTLTGSTPYHIALGGSYAASDTDYVAWIGDLYGEYPGGHLSSFITTWVEQSSYDLCFQVWGVEPPAPAYPIQATIGLSGDTLYSLNDPASITAYGEIQQVISFEGIKPQGNTQADVVAAANALYDAAADWLANNKDPQTSYTVSLGKVRQAIKPGQLVRLIYKGYVWTRDGTKVTWLDTNDLYYVIRPAQSYALEGQTVDLEISSVPRRPATVEQIVANAVETLSLQALRYDPRMDALPSLCGGRLSLSSSLPVTLDDISAATTLHFLPDRDNRVSLYTGDRWLQYVFPPLVLPLDGLPASTNFDVFLFDTQGALCLEGIAWAESTLGGISQVRAVALVERDGVLVKDGDPTRKYLGCFRTTAAGQGEDSLTRRFVWNYYNRRLRRMRLGLNNAHTYTSSTVRQWANLTTFQLEFVLGVVEDAILAGSEYTVQAVAAGNFGRAGYALNRTTGFDSALDNRGTALLQFSNSGAVTPDFPGAHYLAGTQQSNGSGANYATGILTASVWG